MKPTGGLNYLACSSRSFGVGHLIKGFGIRMHGLTDGRLDFLILDRVDFQLLL